MLKYLVAYAATAVIFFACDFVWLSTMGGFYRERAAGLFLDKPNLAIAGLFYLVYVGGIVFLAVIPALSGSGWGAALLAGLVLGLVAYGTYDLTNLSTLKNWPLAVTLVDLAWGTVLTGVAATGGFLLTRWLTA
ncbi:MAG: rane protein [Devosia sp.]|uniref:DUF2177 family protein n=1 Tax=Devosia sp. TaxID=1871048 RepID=UPI002A5D193A|nr:rane protein [Devosia sp.]